MRDMIHAARSEIDQPDLNGLTPLMLCSASRLGTDDATAAQLVATATELLAGGADPHRFWPGCFGSRESHLLPTSFAAMGNAAVLRVLLDHKAPITLAASPGANGNALAHATWSRSAECVSILLEHIAGGADATEGYTPIHWIARTNLPADAVEFVRFVASKRFVDPDALDASGERASTVAEREGHREVAKTMANLEKSAPRH